MRRFEVVAAFSGFDVGDEIADMSPSVPEKRHIYWNFVSSSKERIEQAKDDWRHGRFPEIAGETEFIPLPPDPPGVRFAD